MNISILNRLFQALACATLVAAAGCTSTSGGGSYSTASAGYDEAAPARSANKSRDRLAERPGLGTELGSYSYDSTSQAAFYRRNKYQPDSIGQFFYNDREGAKTMAEMAGNPARRSGAFSLNNGALGVRVVSDSGTCPYYEANGRIIVVGEAGSEYRIELSNRASHQIEAVVSVDGLDTLDGRASSFGKRGYIIGKRQSYSVRGFREGSGIRNFRFGSVANSQAALAGGARGARNVGVIGLAVYEEDEAAAHQARMREGYLRTDARPF